MGPKEDTPLDHLVINAAKIYRIEEVPRDELHIQEDEMLISCAHFQKEVFSTFGLPFLLKIKQGEPFSKVKGTDNTQGSSRATNWPTICFAERIQKRLGVPEKEFEKYKFSIVAMGRQQVLQDDEYIVNLADFRPLPNQGE